MQKSQIYCQTDWRFHLASVFASHGGMGGSSTFHPRSWNAIPGQYHGGICGMISARLHAFVNVKYDCALSSRLSLQISTSTSITMTKQAGVARYYEAEPWLCSTIIKTREYGTQAVGLIMQAREYEQCGGHRWHRACYG